MRYGGCRYPVPEYIFRSLSVSIIQPNDGVNVLSITLLHQQRSTLILGILLHSPGPE